MFTLIKCEDFTLLEIFGYNVYVRGDLPGLKGYMELNRLILSWDHLDVRYGEFVLQFSWVDWLFGEETEKIIFTGGQFEYTVYSNAYQIIPAKRVTKRRRWLTKKVEFGYHVERLRSGDETTLAKNHIAIVTTPAEAVAHYIEYVSNLMGITNHIIAELNREKELPYFNSPKHDAFWPAVIKIHDLCRSLQVSWALHYNEGSDLWYVMVASSVEEENLITKDHSLSITLDLVLEHLQTLSSRNGS